jgi:hypothetical protein
MIELQFFDGNNWVPAGNFYTERSAWISLGGDNFNYRTVDENGDVLTVTGTSQLDVDK